MAHTTTKTPNSALPHNDNGIPDEPLETQKNKLQAARHVLADAARRSPRRRCRRLFEALAAQADARLRDLAERSEE